MDKSKGKHCLTCGIVAENKCPIGQNVGDVPCEPVRDLNADLAICAAATAGPWSLDGSKSDDYITVKCHVGTVVDVWRREWDARFIAEARTGWPHAIRRALAAEAEVARLREEIESIRRAYYVESLEDVALAFRLGEIFEGRAANETMR